MKKLPLIAFMLAMALSQAPAQTEAPSKPAKTLPKSNDHWIITNKGKTAMNVISRQATFHEEVHLNALPKFELDCALLTSTMDKKDKRKFERVEATDNVVIKMHEEKDGKRTTRTAKADKAVYVLATDTVTLTGNAMYQDESGVVWSADVFHYNRTTGEVTSEGDSKVQGEGFGKKPEPKKP